MSPAPRKKGRGRAASPFSARTRARMLRRLIDRAEGGDVAAIEALIRLGEKPATEAAHDNKAGK